LIKKKHANRKSEGKRELESSRKIKIYNTKVGCEFVNWVYLNEKKISDRISQHANRPSGYIHDGKPDHHKSVL